MPLPDVLKTHTRLYGVAPTAPPPGLSLNACVPHQMDDYWCWAAVAFGISLYYSRVSYPQCVIAHELLQSPGHPCLCCNKDPDCKSDARLEPALIMQDNLLCVSRGPRDWPFIVASLEAGNPVAIRIEWTNQTGHFAVIFGRSDDADQTVWIADPKWGLYYPTLSELTTNYIMDAGIWERTYETRRRGTSPPCLYPVCPPPCPEQEEWP
jgi:hypothetical protein